MDKTPETLNVNKTAVARLHSKRNLTKSYQFLILHRTRLKYTNPNPIQIKIRIK